ncbi:alpha-tubulin [Naegleria gruberi]|uniref:Alpha-tubulin n=1 Tax=Naegleria gruberi TaxID=5762 RepID=D2VZB7_NAEGR|nr:alpha-tubulin [Naegleria gruberi]EFC37818.1 alpha-tubulin [Naegleria gruberi]|eukprot:XP_002670562.1 alpha-tubulin [Naegleria gruberi]
MREIISIHIGQAGSQIGNTCWDLLCLEHGIDSSTGAKIHNHSAADKYFFSESMDGTMRARALFVDLDSEIIDKIRSGNNNIYDGESLISGNENTANNFAKGRGVGGNLVLENCLERIEKMVEECDALQGFLITSSLNGGTGSGFRDLLMERLAPGFEKKCKLSFDILASPSSVSSCVESYNVLFGMNSIREYSDASVIVENEALIDICKNKLNVEHPKMTDLNEIIANAISSATISVRREGSLNSSISEIMTNLVPYPPVKYLINSMSPLYPKEFVFCSYEKPTITELTESCFMDKYSVMTNCNLMDGKFMVCTVQYRGDICIRHVSSAIAKIKTSREIKFVDWCPAGFKCGIHDGPLSNIPGGNICYRDRDVNMLSNSTSISQTFSRIEKNFDELYSERSFVHRYLEEGAEEIEFTQCREEIRSVQNDYIEISEETDYEEEV